ncbi:MAG: hypothetical protein Q8P13_01165 [bacterium]|nr:hypothetical protein [bacterium]
MQEFFFISLLLNALALILVVFLVYRGDKTLNEFRPYAKDLARSRKELDEQAFSIVSQARALAEQIVRNATSEGEVNVEASRTLTKTLEGSLARQLQETVSESKEMIQRETRDSVENYQKNLLDLSIDLGNYSKELKKKLLDQANNEISSLSQSIEEEILQVRGETEKKINQRLASSEAEILALQEKKIKSIEENIYQLLTEIAKKTLGKSIDLTTHEDLVMEALEKAKKEKFFS